MGYWRISEMHKKITDISYIKKCDLEAPSLQLLKIFQGFQNSLCFIQHKNKRSFSIFYYEKSNFSVDTYFCIRG